MTRYDLIEKPPANRARQMDTTVGVREVMDRGRRIRNWQAEIMREIATLSTAEGMALVASVIEDTLRQPARPVEEFLICIRKWGASRVVRVCVKAGADAETPVRDLTDSQRAGICRQLRPRVTTEKPRR